MVRYYICGFGGGETLIGEKLKILRQERNLTLRALGEKLGIDYSYLGKVERGKANPSMQLLEDIATFFNVPTGSLFELTDDERDFMSDLELTDDELMDKYNLTIDGKKVSKEKLKQMLAIIRALEQE